MPVSSGSLTLGFFERELEKVWLKPDPGIPTVVRVPLLLTLVVRPLPPMLSEERVLPTFKRTPGATLNDLRNFIGGFPLF